MSHTRGSDAKWPFKPKILEAHLLAYLPTLTILTNLWPHRGEGLFSKFLLELWASSAAPRPQFTELCVVSKNSQG